MTERYDQVLTRNLIPFTQIRNIPVRATGPLQLLACQYHLRSQHWAWNAVQCQGEVQRSFFEAHATEALLKYWDPLLKSGMLC